MIHFVQSNSLHIPLADKSVQCVVTSPPYWGLRDYGIANQLGLEKTPEEYVANMVTVFREVWRVLRDDGVCWLNLGDSYWNGGAEKRDGGHGFVDGGKLKLLKAKGALLQKKSDTSLSLKPKDMVGIPWRVAFALQADGWYLRSDIIWAKPNPMPESVTDRPTKAHEYIFLLTKQERYYYDADAVREEYAPVSLPRAMRGLSDDNKWSNGAPGSTAHSISKPRDNAKLAGSGQVFSVDSHSGYYDSNGRLLINPNGRNRRTVWTIATQAYSGAHFATFPEKLVEPCILAGTSERGCCPVCGSPWVREVKKTGTFQRRWSTNNADGSPYNEQDSYQNTYETIGWQATCQHEAEPIPCTVLDPFSGSGTVGVVSRRHNRRFVGLELSAEYIELAKKRTNGLQPKLMEIT